MDEKIRQAIEHKLATMTEADWVRIREKIHHDPALQAHLREIERSDISPPHYYSGNCLRLP